VIVAEPTLKPSAPVTATLFSVAVPLETATVPSVVDPTVNVTVPVMVPAVPEFTDAIRVVFPPMVTELGVAVTVVVVDGMAFTVNPTVPFDAA
jgi:hypothetical protein